ncbi:cell division protein ZapE [Oerskovia sp. M15]
MTQVCSTDVVRDAVGRDAARRGFSLDPGQAAAVDALAALAAGLDHPAPALSGLYLWGPVGRGKTWLMDAFFGIYGGDARPGGGAVRVHFHDFLRRLHGERFHRGSIDAALDAILGSARLVCFDEFHVHDAGDAMLVARAVRALDARGVNVVLTSNYPPSGLMPSPAYHHLFVPTIDLLVGRLDVVEVGGDHDHRRSPSDVVDGFRDGSFWWPATEAQLAGTRLDRPTPDEATSVRIGTREHPSSRSGGRGRYRARRGGRHGVARLRALVRGTDGGLRRPAPHRALRRRGARRRARPG